MFVGSGEPAAEDSHREAVDLSRCLFNPRDNDVAMSAKTAPDAEVKSRKVIPFPNACAPSAVGEVALGTNDRALLEAARWWVIKSKLTARAIIDEACFLLANGIPSEASAYATAFFRLADMHAKRELRFYALSVKATTDDERWFLQLVNAAIDEDHDSAATLLGWRLEASAQRRAMFLIGQLAQILQKSDLENGGNVFI